MYVIQRKVGDKLAYLKYDGWCVFSNTPLDLEGVVLFTKGEMRANKPQANETWQWYGSYKR